MNKISKYVLINRASIAGILLSLLSTGIVSPVWAEQAINITSNDNANPNTITSNTTIVVGKDNTLTGDEIVVFGSDNTIASAENVDAENVLILGNNNSVLATDHPYMNPEAVIVGFDNKASMDGVAIGHHVNANFYDASSTGNVGEYGVAIGFGSYTEGNDSIAIGAGAYTTGEESVAIGNWANAYGDKSIAIGTETYSTADSTVVIGYMAGTDKDYSVAIGNSAKGWGADAVAIGGGAQAEESSVSIGDTTYASQNSVSIGSKNTTYEDNSIVIGSGIDSYSSNSIAIGYKSKIDRNATNSVAIGANSKATAENVVSFGDSANNLTRRLINVSDGIDDTDVPTMKQLNKVAATKVLAGNNIYVAENTDANGVKNYTISAVVDSSNLEINGDGVIEKDNIGLVSGNTVYNEVHVDTDGSYIKSANTVGNNLSVLDTNLKSLSDKTVYLGMKANINPYDIHTQYLAGGHQLGDLVTTNQPSDTIARYNEEYSNENGIGAVGNRSIAIGQFNIAYGDDTITIGNQALSVGTSKVNPVRIYGLPITQTTSGANSVLIGNHTLNEGDRNVALGYYAQTVFFDNRVMEAGHTYEAKNDVAVGASSLASGENATAVGEHSYAASGGSALGSQASASNYSVSVGYNASTVYNWVSRNPFNQSLIAIGKDSRSESKIPFGIDAISIGNGAKAIDGLAIGDSSVSQSFGSIVIGNHSTSKNVVTLSSENADNLDKNIILGSNSKFGYTSGTAGNVLLGHHTFSQNNKSNSVAIGNNSTITADNVVSFGHKANESSESEYVYSSDLKRRLVNVSDGVSASDAATVGQIEKVYAGSNVSITSGTAYNGANSKTIHVNATGLVQKGNSAIVTGGTVYEAYKNVLNRNEITEGNNIIVSDSTKPPVIKTVQEIIGSYSTGSEKANALANALNTYSNIIQGDPVAALDMTSSEMSDFMGSLYNDSMYGSMTQERFNEIMGKSLTLEEEKFLNKQISVKDNGIVSANDTKLVTGNTVFNEVRVDEDGNYIKAENTTAENLKALDEAVKNAGTGNSNINEELIVKYDSENKDLVTLAGANGTKLTNLKPATLSATSTDAVIGAQLYATNANIEGFASDINRNKTNIASLNTSVTAALGSVSATSTLVTTLNDIKADTSLNNLTNTGKQVIATAAINAVQEYMASQQGNNINNPIAPTVYNSNTLNVTNAGNGSLFVGEGSNVNGSSSIAIGVGNQVNANNSGAFGDPSVINADESYVLGNDDTINTGATGSFIVGNNSISSAKGGLSFGSNNTLENIAENSIALGNNVNITGKNSIALGSNSTAIEDNIVSVGNDTLKRKITNVLDGNISQESTDVITGSQLYATNQKVQENTDAIAIKADLDASNINVPQWAEKLGIGHIAEGDSNLVSGDTVFKAFKDIDTTSDLISYNGVTNQIGIGNNTKYDSVDTINISNSNGDGRVITGVVTNPKDASSAVNIGYLTGVADNIINNVNEGFNETNSRINRVGANAAALASLEPVPTEWDEKWNLSVAVGNFRNETAAAVGAFYKPTSNTMINVKGTVGNKENMVGAGMSIALTKGGNNGPTRLALLNKVDALEKRNNELENTVRTMSEKLDALTMLLEKSNVLSNVQK